MAEYCPTGCEIGECKMKAFGALIFAATELAAEVGATNEQTKAIVDAHGAMVSGCTEYAASDALDRLQYDGPDFIVK